MIADPPLSAGGVKEILACPAAAVAVMFVGDPGTERGVVTIFEYAGSLVSLLLVAVTVKEYAVPENKPVRVMGEDEPVTGGSVETVDVTVYVVIDEPPVSAGASKETVA